MTIKSASFDVGIAALVVDDTGSRCSSIESACRVRAASILKPLLFWVGADEKPYAEDRAAWAALAAPAVTRSDNGATAELWARVGEERLLASIADRTGVVWTTEWGREHPALRVLVTAPDLAVAFASFASDSGQRAVDLRRWMRDVPAEQTFGVRDVAADAFNVPDAVVGVKCGWFGVERVHAVTLVELPDRTVGAAVTTYRPPDTASRAAAVGASGNPAKLLAAHDAFAGTQIRKATRRALEVAASL